MNLRHSLKEAALLLAVAVTVATVSNVLASPRRQLKWIGDMPTLTDGEAVESALPTRPETAELAQNIRIDTDQAVGEWEAGSLFLDARTSDAYYEEGHIPGARSLAVWEGDADDKLMNLMGEYPPETCLVVYCTGGNCEDSDLLRQRLLGAGFNQVLIYQGGFPAWQQAGHPVEF